LFDPFAKALPSNGGKMLCFNMGDSTFQIVFASNLFVEDKLEALKVVDHSL